MSMINSTSPFDRTPRTEPAATAAGSNRAALPGRDQFSARQAEVLRAALEQHPEIRPEVVERGRQLAADPSYPSAGILAKVSAVILTSPDLTEE
jgi:hypothetical protein